MPEHPGWSVAKPLTESGPRDPYAHWQLSQGGYNAAAGSAALTGSPDALDVEWVAPGGTPKGDQQEIPPDGRITPLGALPADVLNGTQSPADVSVADDGLPKDIQAIVGIVDDGIAFANERFRLSNGCTRFDWLWLQGVSDRGAGGTPGPLFGTEFDHATLNAVMADFASKDRAEVHEEALYRRIGLVDPTRPEAMSAAMSASHGTAVLDRAAGCSPDDPDAEHVPIIGVNLPEEITQDTSGAILELFLILGISRILQREIGRAHV